MYIFSKITIFCIPQHHNFV